MTPVKQSPVWHPFTQHALMPDPPEIAAAEGAWLETRSGGRILDAISSWWVVTHGHRHPRIMAAIREQTEKLDQVIFAGFTHAPAEAVGEKLLALVAARAPDRASPGAKPLAHVFFSDSGSTSVEVAIKMALGFWRHHGEPRHRIATFEHAYHGDTIGTMSAGARGVFNAPYEPLLFEVERLPFPAPGCEQATLDTFEAATRGGPLAALLVEPLILGAGGMRTYGPEVLRELKRRCEAAGTLFIADEVMTGFGRTGTLLATEQAGFTPDILCLAKGLTGGTLPLAVTLATSEIFDAHYSPDRTKTFFHSSSYTANPIACAAAAANLDIWSEEPVDQRLRDLSRLQGERMAALAGNLRLENQRVLGTIAAVDVKARDAGYLAAAGPKLYASFLERGVLLRPLGNTVYVMPPYCVTAADLDLAYDTIAAGVAALA